MQPASTPTLTIVALGASAGGLEPLQCFFAAMPVDARFAFVVITHRPPQHASRMPEILQRVTAMPVGEAHDGQIVAPGHVYIMPPDRQMIIDNGRLRLEQGASRPSLVHPIDHFMRALADDQQERAVGIVLSGMEHDGTAGLRAIRAAGGLVLVQDPATAQCPGMPRSAIAAGAVDSVLAAAAMGEALVAYVDYATSTALEPVASTVSADADARDRELAERLQDILDVVHDRSGQEFRWYRPAMLRRRVWRRMGLHSVTDVDAYLELLRRSDRELHALARDFLISVTEFFRQPDAWRCLEEDVLPQLFQKSSAGAGEVRVWNPGCATGEESYSIAMLLLEQRRKLGSDLPVRVFGSDADGEALQRARSGMYPASIAAGVGPQRLAHFFDEGADGYVTRKELRETVLFAPQDLVRDPPFSRLDLIVCRNVLIYFEPAQQDRVLDVFNFALNPNGFLFLGNSESLGLQSDRFEPVSRTHRIFRRAGSTTRIGRPFHGRWSGPGGYLTPVVRQPDGAVDDAAIVNDGQALLPFDDNPAAPAARSDSETARQSELQRLREQLATSERTGANSDAGLRAAHEQMTSLNEELQASNEELQASMEELQSMNEELGSVNGELQEKIEELDHALGDLRNFMDGPQIATIILDRGLRVRRFTKEAGRVFRLIPTDEGRPLSDIASNVADPTLLDDAAAVLEDSGTRDREAATPAGQWFLRRIVPYRTRGERNEGVVISHTEITALRKAADDERRLATVLRDANDAVIVHDLEGHILFWNRGAEQAYGYDQPRARALNIRQLEPPGEPPGRAIALARRVCAGLSSGPVMVRRLTQGGTSLDVLATVSALRNDAGEPYAVVTTERDVTATLKQESELRFRTMADDIPILIRIDDSAGHARYLNRAWLDYTGESSAVALLADGWFRHIHPDDLAGYAGGMARARTEDTRFEGDLRLRRKDGVYRWMQTIGLPRSDEADPPHGYVCVSIDIEERKGAEQALSRDGRRKDEFLAMLAHELRNPLFPIANAVQVIGHAGGADARITWAGQVIARQTKQLARLIEDLMDVARITSDKIVLSREPIAVAALVDLARDQSQPLLDQRQQRLTVALPADTLYIEGDVVRLTQVLANLLNNASKYSAPGDEIGVTVTPSGTDVLISVLDHGIGISPEMLPSVFELFSQETQSLDRPQGGLGIGLNVVDRLVRAHGGSVQARSAGRGAGSEFVVRLPQLLQPMPPAMPAPAASADEAAGARRVLVVDDNVDGLETLEILLQQAGHTVSTAHDGLTALDIARKFHPHVVLLDIGLPGMTGYEVARRLRGRSETARALIVALSGYGQSDDLEKSRAAGFDAHLVKPTPVDAVIAMIRQHADPAVAERDSRAQR